MRGAFDIPVDAGTLERARAGDRPGLERLYRLFERAVYNLARRMTGCPDDAADVTHNTFLRAFRSLPQYRGDAPFGRWLRAICATEALMHLRSGRRFLELLEPETLADPGQPSVEALCQLDLEKALALLPPLPRAVLWLYHVEGYNHGEIAAMCGKSVSFSKSQLSRAHSRLRGLLDAGAQDCAAAPAETTL